MEASFPATPPGASQIECHPTVQQTPWWLVKGGAPEEWTPEEKAAFLRFQDGQQAVEIPDEGTSVELPEKAWLVRCGRAGETASLESWLAEGFLSVSWPEVGDIAVGTSAASIFESVRDAFPEDSAGAWRAWTGNLTSFLNRILVGHLVVTTLGDQVYIGRVTGDPTFHPESQRALARRRSVEWLNADSPASRATIKDAYPSLYSRLRTILTVTDLGPDVSAVAALAELAPPPAPPKGVVIPKADDVLAASLHLPSGWIQEEVLDLLQEKRQLVFYGPPGTGKTFVAQRIADHITVGGGTSRLVQFHPSYSYEDFFEGYRPFAAESGTGVSFHLAPGPLRQLAKAAEEAPEVPHVLIIDELNRGNVPKIFGELLYLLEYRDDSIPLQYSPDADFRLPSNLYIIATMNTADRSIALVDAALRRRFYFVPFLPTEPPVKDVLGKWLKVHDLDPEPADLLHLLNTKIQDADMSLGPSYFMGPGDTVPDLARVWKHAILPLLEEHYHGLGRNIEGEFGLDALRKQLHAPGDPASEVQPEGLPSQE